MFYFFISILVEFLFGYQSYIYFYFLFQL